MSEYQKPVESFAVPSEFLGEVVRDPEFRARVVGADSAAALQEVAHSKGIHLTELAAEQAHQMAAVASSAGHLDHLPGGERGPDIADPRYQAM